ncbi:MAG: SDR family oxidoreductase [Alphaproteobacteria bacterium]
MKIALITGSAIRIGSEIANYLISNHWKVIIHYNKSKAQALKFISEIREQHTYAEIYAKKADFNNENEIRELIQSINNEIGQIDLLINNAAVFENDNIDNFKPSNLNKHMNVNLLAPIILIQEFKNQYTGNEGNIINMLDYCVEKLPDKFFSYTISKSALWTVTKMLAPLIAPNIRINAIGPGPVLTLRQSPENFHKACMNTPLKKGSTIDEICNTIGYILKTPSLTGQHIMLDSGRHLSNYEYM